MVQWDEVVFINDNRNLHFCAEEKVETERSLSIMKITCGHKTCFEMPSKLWFLQLINKFTVRFIYFGFVFHVPDMLTSIKCSIDLRFTKYDALN